VEPPPFNTTAGFLARFVQPLLGGGSVEVEAPLSSHDRAQMLADAGPLLDPDFLHLRTRVGQRLVADPELPDPGADELSLWLGLHDVLALDHPDTERVWTRAATWRKVENETRALLAFARPVDMPDALARHLAVAAFLDLRREDHVVTGPTGDLRLRGQALPRRRFGLFSPNMFAANLAEVRTEVVRWVDAPHATIVDRLLPDVMWVSPLTSLLRPGWAPPGWTPLMAVEFLHARPYARAVCHTWAQAREWLRVGGVVAGSLLRSLDLHAAVFGDVTIAAIPGATPTMQRAAKAALEDVEPPTEHDPEFASGAIAALPAPAIASEPHDIGAVVGALIHLHVLKVLEFDARISIGLGARDWAVQTFLAMPLLLPSLAPTLGWPFEFAGEVDGESGDEADREPGGKAAKGEPRTGEPVRVGAAPVDGGFARRWAEYTEHLAGLVPRNIVDNLQATLVRRIRE
jgi:hypothetical protein